MPNNSLRLIRDKKGLTLAQLAGKTSISIRTLQMYEVGERPISADDLRKLSRVLFTPTADLLQPSADLPPAPPKSAEPFAQAAPRTPSPPSFPTEDPVAATGSSPPLVDAERPAAVDGRTNGEAQSTGAPAFGRRPSPSTGSGEFRRPVGAATAPRSAPAPRAARPPREPRPSRPPGPSTKGQMEQIHNLARRMGLDAAAVEERIGAPLSSLDHLGARNAIARLRQELEDSGTWQPRVGEGADQEGAYLGKLRDQGVSVVARLIDGQSVEGVVVDFTPYVIRLRQEDHGEVTVRKLAIAYYQTKGPIRDSQ